MEKEITVGKETFSYVDNGKYIRITGYGHEDGTLQFTGEEDGKSYFHIHIPETIDGLPVLIVDKLWLDVDYIHGYRHNGLDVVLLHLPENTAFLGLSQLSTGMNSVFVPNFSEAYYSRKNRLFRRDEGVYHFFAEELNGTTCNIFAIIGDNCIKKDWVWSKDSQEPLAAEKLTVPACIDGHQVLELCSDSTRALPEQLKEVHIEEGVEVIGAQCFAGLPYLTDVYLPGSLKQIGAGAFSYYEESRYIKKVPPLCVHYDVAMPPMGENAFVRGADREDYEEYADWGNMYVGSTHLDYEVLYQKK